MIVSIHDTKDELGRAAAGKGAAMIRKAIQDHGSASIILATGASQVEMLHELSVTRVNWSLVTAFHLDEYIGFSPDHPASFRRYLRERFADKVPLKAFHEIDGEADPVGECARLGGLIGRHPVDVAFIGIGENGHLAFNDPPADLETEEPYITVELDDACRAQQFKEGWFASLQEVPRSAISMSIRQILQSGTIICTVPDARKAAAVRNALEGPVSPECPASVLRSHKQVCLFLDRGSSSLIRRI
jgi:glucosamine-6-phosphate deaminase